MKNLDLVTDKSLVIKCFDYRLVVPIHEHLKELAELGRCDMLSIAGGALDVAHPNPYVIHQINLSYLLHKIKEVVLINHTDCGAYKHVYFVDSQAEKLYHFNELAQAVTTIRNTFPRIEGVSGLLAVIGAEGTVTFEG